MTPVVDLMAPTEGPGDQIEWVTTGPSDRRHRWPVGPERYEEERLAREHRGLDEESLKRAAAIEWARERHPQIMKLNAVAVRNGYGPTTSCSEWCPICHPEVLLAPTAEEMTRGLTIADLRAGSKIPVKHKRGRCKVCGIKCPKIRVYCSDACRLAKKPAAPPPLVCGFCRKPLMGARKKWCNESCRAKAYRRTQNRR